MRQTCATLVKCVDTAAGSAESPRPKMDSKSAPSKTWHGCDAERVADHDHAPAPYAGHAPAQLRAFLSSFKYMLTCKHFKGAVLSKNWTNTDCKTRRA
jgi:hypothetical protein